MNGNINSESNRKHLWTNKDRNTWMKQSDLSAKSILALQLMLVLGGIPINSHRKLRYSYKNCLSIMIVLPYCHKSFHKGK